MDKVAYLRRNSGEKEIPQSRGERQAGAHLRSEVERDRFMVVNDTFASRAAVLAVGLSSSCAVVARRAAQQAARAGRPGRAGAASGDLRPVARRRPAAIRRLPASAAAFSTISAAMPATAIRWNSARSPSSTPAKARYRPAICARRPGKAPTPRASNSPRRISSIRTSSIPSTAMPSMTPPRRRSISTSRSRKRLDLDRRRRVSDRAHGARDRGRARRQDHSRFSGL